MRVSILAIGRMKNGPELDLLNRYVDRANKAGSNLHLLGPSITDFPEDRSQTAAARKEAEAGMLLGVLPQGAHLIALDEGGKSFTSAEFANRLRELRDDGVNDLAFALGGPDGHGDALLYKAHHKLALGTLTWPHQIARILLSEQIYRAMTILSGHPYHRK